MALISLPDLVGSDFAYVETLEENFQTLENEVNGLLDNTNIAAGANIDPAKIGNGGAVSTDDTTTTGAVNKIPILDASGNITISGKIVFVEGLI